MALLRRTGVSLGRLWGAFGRPGLLLGGPWGTSGPLSGGSFGTFWFILVYFSIFSIFYYILVYSSIFLPMLVYFSIFSAKARPGIPTRPGIKNYPSKQP